MIESTCHLFPSLAKVLSVIIPNCPVMLALCRWDQQVQRMLKEDAREDDRTGHNLCAKMWLEAAKHKMGQFMARLEEIKRQRDYATSARAHWGDVPARWPRL